MSGQQRRPLKRSHDSMLGGVCGGIADCIGWPASRVRVLYVLVSILSAAFPGTLAYLILWAVMPPPDYESRRRVDLDDHRKQ